MGRHRAGGIRVRPGHIRGGSDGVGRGVAADSGPGAELRLGQDSRLVVRHASLVNRSK